MDTFALFRMEYNCPLKGHGISCNYFRSRDVGVSNRLAIKESTLLEL